MTTSVATPAQPMPAERAAPFSPAYTRYAMWFLLLISTLNYLDRQVVNILAESIKRDLELSDTQIGLMTGLAFALFYTFLGLPLARFADNPKISRTSLIAASLAAWSAMTVMCGMAQNFAQLLLARVGVGVGEAGCAPAAHSLITDMVPREKHASSMAFYGIGIPIGGLLGMVMGGLLADLYGWRSAFLVLGLPGLICAVLLWTTLKEPRRVFRARALTSATPAPPQMSFREAIAEVAASKAFVLITIAASFVAFLGYGKTVWQAILFIRTHHLSPGQVGLWLGISAGVAGSIGMFLGGYFADRFGAKDPRRVLAAPIVGMALGAPLLVAGYLQADWRIALMLIFLPSVANNLFYGPTFSCAQRLVSPPARAMASAIILFVINLIGLGLGPLFFGMLSDAVQPFAGDQSVRWVLAGAAGLGVVPAAFFWLASRHLNRELKTI
jgi:predicted MFS family arabinose efflux permease